MARLVTLHDTDGEIIYPQSVWDENMIPDDTVTSNMVDWSTFGDQSSYIDLGAIRICFGSTTITGIPTGAFGEKNKSITFPASFASNPIVVVQPGDMSNSCGEYASTSSLSTTGVNIWGGHSGTTSATSMEISWIAIGVKA